MILIIFICVVLFKRILNVPVLVEAETHEKHHITLASKPSPHAIKNTYFLHLILFNAEKITNCMLIEYLAIIYIDYYWLLIRRCCSKCIRFKKFWVFSFFFTIVIL